MAYDKLVDSAKLDVALTSTAVAIRAKAGGVAPIPFDIEGGTGFAGAIEPISSSPDGTEVAFGNQNGEPVEREDAYSISSEDLNAIGAITQKMAGKSALMTVADMIYWLNRVQFIPQGNAESSFSLSFDSAVSGVLPDVQRGTATSAFSLSFTASAVGELQEG